MTFITSANKNGSNPKASARCQLCVTIASHAIPVAEQNDLSCKPGDDIAPERSRASLRDPTGDKRNYGISHQVAASGTEKLRDSAKTSRAEHRESHTLPNRDRALRPRIRAYCPA